MRACSRAHAARGNTHRILQLSHSIKHNSHTQRSAQTSGMREGINSGWPHANFSRKQVSIRNDHFLAKLAKENWKVNVHVTL